MSHLVDHAQRELERAGMFDADADYNGALAPAIMDVVRVFAAQEHSGASAAISLGILERLLRFENLTPLTSDPAEWQDVSDFSGGPMWQNRRRGSTFSRDGGQTWYDIEDPSRDHGDTWKRDDGGGEGMTDEAERERWADVMWQAWADWPKHAPAAPGPDSFYVYAAEAVAAEVRAQERERVAALVAAARAMVEETDGDDADYVDWPAGWEQFCAALAALDAGEDG